MARGAGLLVALLLAACGGSRPRAQSPSGDDVVEKVVHEKMPDGRIQNPTNSTTKSTARAPSPPPRPEDPYPSDPLVRYNVERINAYRSNKGLPALLYDAKISTFAKAGSEQYSRDHTPHQHFADHAQGAPGFGSRSAENQGDP